MRGEREESSFQLIHVNIYDNIILMSYNLINRMNDRGNAFMGKVCYHCGTAHDGGHFCNNCGTNLNPPRDVYFVDESCGDCDASLPRWARFCPNCGRPFGFTEPISPERVAKRNKGLVAGALFFSVVFLAIPLIISLAEDSIPIQYALIAAAALITLIWIITVIRWERGKYKDGTVIRHTSEERTRSERDISNTTASGKAKRINIAYTLYSTYVQYDDGTTDTFNLENPANHIQLAIGDRVRYYTSTRTYRKM